MRMVLLRAAAGVMMLVPLSTAAVLAAFPHEVRLIPVWFWVVWFLLSVWAALDAPLRVGWFVPANREDQAMRYARTGMVLALANVVWSIAAVIYLGWWS